VTSSSQKYFPEILPFSRLRALVLSLSALCNLAIAAFAGVGLRGTDQYWYATNLIMAKEGSGFRSNSLFPSAYFPAINDQGFLLPPFVHNIPVSYLAAAVNQVVADPYMSWLALNTALCFGTALILYSLALRLWTANWATFVASVTLIFPHSVWFGLNALSEQFIIFLISLLVWSILRAVGGEGRYVWLASLCIYVLALSRDNHILLFFVFAIYLIILRKWNRLSNFELSAPFILLSMAYILTRFSIPSYPSGGVLGAISSGTETISNRFPIMSSYYDPSFVAPISEIAMKVSNNIVLALLPASSLELLLETLPILLLLIGVSMAPRTKIWFTINFWSISFFAVYLATSVVFQAQSRYAVIFVSVSIIYGALIVRILTRNLRRGTKTVIAAVVFLGLVIPSVAMALYYRTSAALDAYDLQEIAGRFSDMQNSNTLLVDLDVRVTQKIGFAIAPSAVIIVDSGSLGQCLTPDFLNHYRISSIIGPPNMTWASASELLCAPSGQPWQPSELVIEGDGYQLFR